MSHGRPAPLLIALLLLVGCGGSGGSHRSSPSADAVAPRVAIAWPARSRAVQGSASALSAKITLQATESAAPPLTYTVDRPSGTGAVTQTSVAPKSVLRTPLVLRVYFYAGTGGTGDLVATAAADVALAPDGVLTKPDGSVLGDIAFTGTISALRLVAPGYLDLGTTNDLAVAAIAQGSILALSPGSFQVKVTKGSDVLVPEGGLSVKAIKEGAATVVATVDGVSSEVTPIGVQGTPLSPRSIALATSALIADPSRDRLWTSLPSGASIANAVVDIDPATGTLGVPIPVGANPGPLAISDDGSTLFVGLTYERTVRPVALATRTSGAAFPVVQNELADAYALQIAVQPGSASTVAITTNDPGFNSSGPAVYDAGVPRPNHLGYRQGTLVAWTSTARLIDLEGANSAYTAFDLAVDATGVHVENSVPSVLTNTSTSVVVANGRAYVSDGTVLDAATLQPLGRFDMSPFLASGDAYDAGPLLDVTANRAYFAVFDDRGGRLLAYRLDTLVQTADRPLVGRFTPPTGPFLTDPGLVRIGAHGLAFRTFDHIYFVDDVSSL